MNLACIYNGQQFFSDQGVVLSGGKINTYLAGTTTPAATYTDPTGSTPNANPIILGSNGRPPQEIWIPAGTLYKFILTDASNNVLATLDNLSSIGDGTANSLNFTQAGSGAVTRTVQDKLSDWVHVKDFGAVGNGVTDDTAAIQAAITYLQSTTGGTVLLGSKHKISSTITIGNGTSGASPSHSTTKAVFIHGQSIAGIGNNNPLGGTNVIQTGNLPAFTIRGPLDGWGIENVFISFTSTGPGTAGIQVLSAQYGNVRNVVVDDPPDFGFILNSDAAYLTAFNSFENCFVWMGNTHTNAVALILTGTVAYSADAATNRFVNFNVTPSVSTQKGIWLQYCDTNLFLGYTCLPAAATAILFDYSLSTSFPGGNLFVQVDPYNNSISNAGGTPSETQNMSPNRIVQFSQGNGAVIPSLNGLACERQIMSANKVFYVSTTGNDTTGTGFSGNPWATIQKAYNMIVGTYDLNGFTATIQLADGTYSAGLIADSKPNNKGTIVVNGNVSTPSNVVISVSSGTCVTVQDNASLVLQNVKLQNSGGTGVFATDGGIVTLGVVFFGTCSGAQVQANKSGVVYITGNYTISGNGGLHWYSTNGGNITADAITITLSGTPAFSTAFAAAAAGFIECFSDTFSGSATGTRYLATLNGVINTNGGGANYLPGNASGSSSTGGQYA